MPQRKPPRTPGVTRDNTAGREGNIIVNAVVDGALRHVSVDGRQTQHVRRRLGVRGMPKTDSSDIAGNAAQFRRRQRFADASPRHFALEVRRS